MTETQVKEAAHKIALLVSAYVKAEAAEIAHVTAWKAINESERGTKGTSVARASRTETPGAKELNALEQAIAVIIADAAGT